MHFLQKRSTFLFSMSSVASLFLISCGKLNTEREQNQSEVISIIANDDFLVEKKEENDINRLPSIYNYFITDDLLHVVMLKEGCYNIKLNKTSFTVESYDNCLNPSTYLSIKLSEKNQFFISKNPIVNTNFSDSSICENELLMLFSFVYLKYDDKNFKFSKKMHMLPSYVEPWNRKGMTNFGTCDDTITMTRLKQTFYSL